MALKGNIQFDFSKNTSNRNKDVRNILALKNSQVKKANNPLLPSNQLNALASGIPKGTEKMVVEAKKNYADNVKKATVSKTTQALEGVKKQQDSMALKKKQNAETYIKSNYKLSDDDILQIANRVKEKYPEETKGVPDLMLAYGGIRDLEERGSENLSQYKLGQKGYFGDIAEQISTNIRKAKTDINQADESLEAGNQGKAETFGQKVAAIGNAISSSVVAPLTRPAGAVIGAGISGLDAYGNAIQEAGATAGTEVGNIIREGIGKPRLDQEQEQQLRDEYMTPNTASQTVGAIGEQYNKLSPRVKRNLAIGEVVLDVATLGGTKSAIKGAKGWGNKLTKGSKVVGDIPTGGVPPTGAGTKTTFQKVKDTVSEYYTDLGDADKKAMSSNPYIPKYAQEVIEKVKKDGVPLDNDDLISDALQKNADRVVKGLDNKKNVYGEQGKLYKELRDALSDEVVDNNILRQEIINKLPEGKTLQGFIKDVDKQSYEGLSKIFEVADDGETLINSNITIPKLHDMRKSVDRLIDVVENKGTAKELTLLKIRKVIDQKLKENQLWKENDEIYSEMRQAYDKLKEGLVYKDRARLNEPRDNIVQIIKNLNTPNRQKLKDRIMADFPGLDKEIEALNYMPRFIKKYLANPKVTTGLAVGGVVGGTVGGIRSAIIGGALGGLGSALGSKRLGGKKRNIIEGIVSRMSKAQQGELEEIAKQIKKASQTNYNSLDVMKKQKERIAKRKADAKTRELLEKILKNATKEEKAMLPNLGKEVFEAGPEGVQRKIGDKPAGALSVTPKDKLKPKVIEFSSPNRLDSKQTTIGNFTRKILSKEEIDLLDGDLKDKYNEFAEAMYSKDYGKLDGIFTKVSEGFESGLYDPRQQKIMDKMLDSAENDGGYIEWISNRDIVPEINYTEVFRKEAERIEAKEQRIGKVGNKKVGKEFKNEQRKDRMADKENFIENIKQELNLDSNQAQDYYDNLLSRLSKDAKPKPRNILAVKKPKAEVEPKPKPKPNKLSQSKPKPTTPVSKNTLSKNK